jgi:hypothetical protein
MQGRIASNEVNQSYCVLTATRPSAIAIQKPRREIFISGSPRFRGRATPLALFISARWASVSRDQETSYQETRRDPPTDFLAFYDRAPDDHFVGSERGADLPTKVFGAADEEPAGGVDACPQNDAAREEGEGTGHLLLHLLALASARPRSHFVSRGSQSRHICARTRYLGNACKPDLAARGSFGEGADLVFGLIPVQRIAELHVNPAIP